MQLDREVTFVDRNRRGGTDGISTRGQFTAYARQISQLVKGHIVKELAKAVPELGGHEVRVTVGLDLGNNPLLAVDVI